MACYKLIHILSDSGEKTLPNLPTVGNLLFKRSCCWSRVYLSYYVLGVTRQTYASPLSKQEPLAVAPTSSLTAAGGELRGGAGTSRVGFLCELVSLCEFSVEGPS